MRTASTAKLFRMRGCAGAARLKCRNATPKVGLKEQTEAAVARGLFGCPTMIGGDRLGRC